MVLVRLLVEDSPEQFANLIGIIHHGGAQRFGQRREAPGKKAFFHIGRWVAHFAGSETIQPCKILPLGALVEAVSSPPPLVLAVATRRNMGVRYNQFPAVFRYAQGGSVNTLFKPAAISGDVRSISFSNKSAPQRMASAKGRIQRSCRRF